MNMAEAVRLIHLLEEMGMNDTNIKNTILYLESGEKKEDIRAKITNLGEGEEPEEKKER